MKKNEKTTYIILVAIVILIIVVVNIVKNNNASITIEELKCIAEKSKLILSSTCSHCIEQKRILKSIDSNYTAYLDLIYVDEHPEVFEEYDITGVPTWIINEKTYSGVHQPKELKKIADC
ncbi:thioredoxin family protein [Candidatus Pacearchaeota archaeon]|nr:thioredoxin family protein [Candidatus Pacearchaeota archaeon]